MRAARWMVATALAGVAGVSSLFTFSACNGAATTIGASAEGGIPPVMLADGSWGQSECAACTFDACSSQRTDCQAEPSCAVYLDCIEVCARTAEGDPDPACVAACPLPTSSAADHARLAFEDCRIAGAATSCATCTAAQRRRHTNPGLTSFCADGMYDASPDDTAIVKECSTCGATKCCAPHKAYVADPGAFALRTCIQGCNGAQSCLVACDEKYDSSVVAWYAFFACDLVLCAKECQFTLNDCSGCVADKCADELVACQSDHDCVILSDCIGTCGASAECQAACRAKYPTAGELLSTQILCAGKYCPACH